MFHFGSQQAERVLADVLYINMSLAVIIAPDPAGHGWVIDNGEIELKWMSIDAVPEELLHFVNCGCNTGCESNRFGLASQFSLL